MPPVPLMRSGKSLRTTDSPITYYIQKALENPSLISFAAGLVDESSFPCSAVERATSAVFADPRRARAALQYGTTQGSLELRRQLLDKFCRADGVEPAGLSLTPADVVVTTGSQQLLYLLGELFIDPGDIVIAEAPSYFVYHSLLQSHGARVLAVPMDEYGMQMDALSEILEGLERTGDIHRVKMIYTVDYFQNPTGLTLSADRRPRLVELARRFSRAHRILIVEDAAYRELRYDGDDIPSVKRHDPHNEYVAYTGTFSKSLSPGLKTGYAFLPRDVMEPLLHLKGSHDFGSTNYAQHLISEMIAAGDYSRHVEFLCAQYRLKRDRMLGALDREFGDLPQATWTVPAGGLYVWLRLEGMDTGPTGPLVPAALEAGALYVPGEFGHVADELGRITKNECRLSFGVATPEQVPEGIRRLRTAVGSVLANPQRGKLVAQL